MIKAYTEKPWKFILLIAVLFLSIPTFAAPIKVTGRVQDVNGEPLIGVTVKEKGTDNMTVTDVNGTYNITCSSNTSILVAAYIGFTPEERKVTGTLIDFVLKDEVSKLDEVTVVGYTTAKKVSVLGAQSSLKMDQVKAPVANMSSILAGRVSGVVSVQRTGVPGQDDSDIWIRGISTLTNRNEGPLILVDGIERSFNNLDPEDIASVTILKDAASTAVYGVRGGNGVVIITTKPGIVSKPRFSVDFYQGVTQLTKVPDLVDGIGYMNAVNEAYHNTFGKDKSYYSQQYITNTEVANGLPSPGITDEQRQTLLSDRTVNKYLYPNVDWMKELYHDYGWNRRVNMNIRGGAPNANYYISLSYYQEKGLTKTDPMQEYSTEIDYNRYNFLTNVNLKATKMTNIDVGVSGYFSSGNYPNQDLSDIFGKAMNTNPVIYPVQYPNGENPGFSQVQREFDNPWVTLTRRGYQTQYQTQINSNLKVEQDLGFWGWSKGLTARALVAFDLRATQALHYAIDNSTWKPRGSKDPLTGDTWVDDENLYDADGNIQLQEEFKGNTTMSFKSDKWVYRTFYFETALDYKHTFDKLHNVSGLVVFNIRNYRDANGNLIESLPHKQESLSGRLTYDYDNRYFVEANLGYTGSENFAQGHRFGLFPAWALGWVPSNETWWKNMSPYISFLKFRYSDGTVGNDSQNGRFGYFTEITGKNGYSSYWGSNGIGFNKYGFFAQWSKIRKQDLGIEINFFKDDLTFVFDLFKERRTKIFVDRNNLPLLAGFAATASANVGIVKNKGYEASFEYSHQFGKDLFIAVRGNVTQNSDEVIENAEAVPAYPWLERRGHNVLARWGYVAEGLYTSKEEITQRGITQFGETHPGELVKPGDIKYKDLNGDKHIDENDMTCIGRGDIPRIYYGFGGDIRYQNIGLGILFQGTADADRMLDGNGIRPFTSSSGGGTLYSNIEDRWRDDDPTNDKVFYPRLAWGAKDPSNTNNFVSSTWWQRDVSFLRLKQFTVSYYFPKAWSRVGFIKGGRFYLMGENVLTFSKFKLWDPELNTNNGISYPNVKTFSIGVNVNI